MAGGLFDLQKIALTVDAAARAAVAQRTPPLTQEHVLPFRFMPRVLPFTGRSDMNAQIFDLTAGGGAGLLAFGFGSGSTLFGRSSPPRGTEERSWRPEIQSFVASATVQQRDLVSRVAAVRDLIQKEQISAARRLLEVMPMGAEEPAIARLRRALTPPSVRASPRRDIDRTHAYEWLRQHGYEHKNQWVAINEDGLVASAPTLKALRERLRALAPVQQPLIHKL